MNKTEFVTELAKRTDQSKVAADAFLEAFQDIITEQLKAKNDVVLVGFGTFKITEKKERTGRNPGTGESIVIAAAASPVFKAGTRFKSGVA